MESESTRDDENTPVGLREEVRSGILDSIHRDVERRGGRTARRLVAAGVAGVVGALGVTLLVSTHPFAHHPPWHVAVFSAVWSGLLVVTFAIAFLDLRTPTLSLARSASVGLLGLGLAGICGALCPENHFLHWWWGTSVGEPLTRAGGPVLSALCFGLCTTVAVGLVSSFLLLVPTVARAAGPIVPAAMLFVLLLPGVALQSFGSDLPVFGGWLAGTAAGAYVGVLGGSRLRTGLRTRR